MTYPTKVVKVTFGGSLFQTNEIWQAGLTLAKPGTDIELTQAQLQALADAIGPVVDGYFTDITYGIAPAVRLEWTKTALLSETGKYALASPGLYDTSPAIVGNGSSNYAVHTLPQSALAVTLDSRKRGPRGRLSRFYLPMPVLSIDPATGRALGAAVSFLDASAGFIRRVNEAAGNVVEGLVVVSASKLGEGNVNPIVSVRIGDVVDTMRSRRNALQEVYTYQDVNPSDGEEPEA